MRDSVGCGEITTIIEKQEGTISWKDFGYENNYEDKIDLAGYKTVGPLTFDAIAYERTLLSAMDRLIGL